MKFLLDQDVYAATVRFLSALGHDVVPVAKIGLSRQMIRSCSQPHASKTEFLFPGTETLEDWSSSKTWEQASFIFVCCLQHRMRFIKNWQEC